MREGTRPAPWYASTLRFLVKTFTLARTVVSMDDMLSSRMKKVSRSVVRSEKVTSQAGVSSPPPPELCFFLAMVYMPS